MFEWQDDPRSRRNAREQFIRELHRLQTPRVIDDLAGKSMAIYQALWDQHEEARAAFGSWAVSRAFWTERRALTDWSRLTRLARSDARFRDLRDALLAWARPYHLDHEGWLLTQAMGTLRLWCGAPLAQAERWWALDRARMLIDYVDVGGGEPPGLVPLPGGVRRLVPSKKAAFRLPAWDLATPREEAEAEALENAKRVITAHYDQMVERHRLVPQPVPKRVETPHYRWLVAFQVKGDRYTEIASDAGVRRQAVEQAVKETAQLVGLSLRRASGSGRPRTTSRPTSRTKRRITP